MHKPFFALLGLVLAFSLLFHPPAAHASSEGVEHMTKAVAVISQALDAAKQDQAKAKALYDQFHDQWMDVEDTVKADSKAAYKDIESQMGQVDYAFLVNQPEDVVSALQQLRQVLERYVQGQYAEGTDGKESNITLPGFITLLKQTKESVAKHDQTAALQGIGGVRESWLSVEGHVVAQSASVYSDSERDMVVIQAMITKQQYDAAAKRIDDMIAYLAPLAEKTTYTVWDAAMIPIREGLEALLVVGALLAFVKKSKSAKGSRWIWSGVLAGLALSGILAVIVKFVFSSGAFGTNNFLIAGWTGIFAAAMLLYMSYWLHSKSNVKQWNDYIRVKTETALSTGNVFSLALLSFLAIFREGTETVLFLVGMVNQIGLQQLLLGIVLGIGILAVLAFLMLYVGMKLPIRPFFLVSSLIVFYLCIKFTGLGIHSLQLAGTLGTSNSSLLPSLDFLGMFPSWESTIPQFTIALGALAFLLGSRISKRSAKLTS
ncbi:FTR1 family iron permease [Paenibacillus elgii]|uniref:FTR1 family iron permease n=1 Tax=Paenibacillus elgii TaxID=189691 RepID=UPI000FDB3F63|nr:FTR1 family protein [Paenibacillus elgii]NEN87361.1 iron permease [Paenibacillus elgii]